MPCRSILVVEDDEQIRKQVTAALEYEGYEVLAARNGKHALEILTPLSPGELPGCMILDLMMPEMDGRTLIEVIRRDHTDRLGGISILVATAKGSLSNPESLPPQVVRIQKPFELDELYEAVGRHCGKPQGEGS